MNNINQLTEDEDPFANLDFSKPLEPIQQNIQPRPQRIVKPIQQNIQPQYFEQNYDDDSDEDDYIPPEIYEEKSAKQELEECFNEKMKELQNPILATTETLLLAPLRASFTGVCMITNIATSSIKKLNPYQLLGDRMDTNFEEYKASFSAILAKLTPRQIGMLSNPYIQFSFLLGRDAHNQRLENIQKGLIKIEEPKQPESKQPEIKKQPESKKELTEDELFDLELKKLNLEQKQEMN